MNRILLLLEQRENHRLLATLLGQRCLIVDPPDLQESFDLAIIDGPSLSRLRQQVGARKEEDSAFLPFLLLTTRQERGSLTQQVWQIIDEIITAPIEKVELQARIEMLLRTRRLSLELKLRSEALQQRYDELTVLQDELLRKNEALEALNQQKNQWLGTAAHDLRTPLGVISTYSDFLLEEAAGQLAQGHVDFIARIKSSSQFMRELVDDLLDISKIEAGKLDLNLQRTDLAELVRNNVTLNSLLSERKQIQLVCRCPESVPPLMADPAKIEQVLNNLIGNAIKFSHSGTTVEVGIEQRDNIIVLSVKDEGQGIPEEQTELLFEPFVRTSVMSTDQEKSTGLGLAIVHRIVEGHGGKIWVKSQIGKGSTFFISLPLRVGKDEMLRAGKDESEETTPREETFDREAALQRFGGDVSALKQHIAAFAEECPRLLTSIRETIGRNEGRRLARMAYSLGWSLSQLGAGTAFDMALQLEKQGRTGNLDGAEEAYTVLEQEIENLRSTLDSIGDRQ